METIEMDYLRAQLCELVTQVAQNTADIIKLKEGN